MDARSGMLVKLAPATAEHSSESLSVNPVSAFPDDEAVLLYGIPGARGVSGVTCKDDRLFFDGTLPIEISLILPQVIETAPC